MISDIKIGLVYGDNTIIDSIIINLEPNSPFSHTWKLQQSVCPSKHFESPSSFIEFSSHPVSGASETIPVWMLPITANAIKVASMTIKTRAIFVFLVVSDFVCFFGAALL